MYLFARPVQYRLVSLLEHWVHKVIVDEDGVRILSIYQKLVPQVVDQEMGVSCLCIRVARAMGRVPPTRSPQPNFSARPDRIY